MRPIYLLAITVAVLLTSQLKSAAQNNQKECREKFLHQFTYSGKYLDISGETTDARATFWKTDGTIVFIVGRFSNNVTAYKLNDPWQIHTAEFLYGVSLPGEFQHGLYIREDGMMMWVFDRTSIWSFTLKDPWDITTRSAGTNHNISDFTLRGHDIDFKPDGTILFIDDRDAGAVFEYSLSTPWDVTTGTLTYTLDISDQQIEVRGIEFLKDGTMMMLMDTERKEVMQYNLTGPYEISTATFFDAFDVSDQTQEGRGLSFSIDETIMYVTAQDEGKVFQYERFK
jgi:sugar lactone lactonase YvrE